jgi:NitT/TauT family transport system substrate-binding protein
MIKSEDKIADVITRFPFIKEKLMERNRIFANLNNPVLFKTVGRFAKISDIAKVSGEQEEDLLAFINGLIAEKGESDA